MGFAGVVRDANVELRQGGLQASDDDVGFVPALHLSGDYRIGERWLFRLDSDGLADGPGRLIDLGVILDYQLNDGWRIGGGYRTLEGASIPTTSTTSRCWLMQDKIVDRDFSADRGSHRILQLIGANYDCPAYSRFPARR